MRNYLITLLIFSASICSAQEKDSSGQPKEKSVRSWLSGSMGVMLGNNGFYGSFSPALNFSIGSQTNNNIISRFLIKPRLAFGRKPDSDNYNRDIGLLIGGSFGNVTEVRIAAGLGKIACRYDNPQFGGHPYWGRKVPIAPIPETFSVSTLSLPCELTISSRLGNGGFGVSLMGSFNSKASYLGLSLIFETGISNFRLKDNALK
jgi:hypothetical protein